MTVPITVLVHHGGFPLWAAIHWSHNSLRTPAVHFIVSSKLSTTIWIYSHRIRSSSVFLLRAVLRMIFNCASWVIFLSLYWQCCSGLTADCIAAAFEQMAHGIKLLSFGLILIRSQLVELCMEPLLAIGENVRKIMTKRSGKSWRIWS